MKTGKIFAAAALFWSTTTWSDTTRFCLDGELDLGTRYQGTEPAAGETYPTRWCVITEDKSERVLFSGRGKCNPDMDSEFTVAYLDDGLVVGDAPAGWPELHQVPPYRAWASADCPRDWPTFSGNNFPERKSPRSCLHISMTITPAASASVLAESLSSPDMPKDRLSRQSANVRVIGVSDQAHHLVANNEVRLVTLNDNPHVGAMLAMWAVEAGFVFVSDIHVPDSDTSAPGAHRAESEYWFAKRALSVFPGDVQVVNSHSEIITPVSRLAEYLRSDRCRTDSD